MQTPFISKAIIQETPIRTIRLEWVEDNINYNVEVPVSWALAVYGFRTISDRLMGCAETTALLLADIEANPEQWVAAIMLDEEISAGVCSLACAKEFIPEQFRA